MEERPWCATPSLPTGGGGTSFARKHAAACEAHAPCRLQDRVIEKSIRRPLQKTRFGAVSYGLIKTGRDG